MNQSKRVEAGRLLRAEKARRLTDMPLLVIERIMTLLSVASAIDVLKCKTLCKTLRSACEADDVYRNMETDRLTSMFRPQRLNVLGKCREFGNPNLMFLDGMKKFFYYNQDTAGKELLEEASSLGQRDAKYVLAMMLIAEGIEKKEEAVKILNEEYRASKKTWDVQGTCTKVQRLLGDPEGRKQLEFHGFLLTCHIHTARNNNLSRALVVGDKWILDCSICLWDACFAIFARTLGKQYMI